MNYDAQTQPQAESETGAADVKARLDALSLASFGEADFDRLPLKKQWAVEQVLACHWDDEDQREEKDSLPLGRVAGKYLELSTDQLYGTGGRKAMRLYKMEITSVPAECDDDWKPEGWAEFVAQEIERGRNWAPDESFFWPSEDKFYRSRSSATEKVAIVRRWGGDARVLEAEVGPFIPVAEMNARRKRNRDNVRIAKLRARIKAIEAQG